MSNAFKMYTNNCSIKIDEVQYFKRVITNFVEQQILDKGKVEKRIIYFTFKYISSRTYKSDNINIIIFARVKR